MFFFSANLLSGLQYYDEKDSVQVLLVPNLNSDRRELLNISLVIFGITRIHTCGYFRYYYIDIKRGEN